jgi:hypothetical protein
MVMAPVLVPNEVGVGVKVTERVQLLRAPKEVPQVLVWAKLFEATMLGIVRSVLPVLVKFTVAAALTVPTS